MTGKDEALLANMRSILKERGYEKECFPLEDVAKRIERTRANVNWKIWLYKWSSMALLILIPLLSTSLSIFATDKMTATFVVALTYSLTVLTLFNSIFRPSLRFRELCEMGIAIQDLEDDFLTELENLAPRVEEASLHAIREAFHKRLMPYERRLIALFLPSEVAPLPTTKSRLTPSREIARHAAAGHK